VEFVVTIFIPENNFRGEDFLFAPSI